MTTHELARRLLAMQDIPVVHHYNHMDDFDHNPYDYYSNITIFIQEGHCCISTGDVLDCVEDLSFWEEEDY